MKKILVIADSFPPYWAPRVGYLCKYIQRYGYATYVVALNRNRNKVNSHLVNYPVYTKIVCEKANTSFVKRLFELLLPTRYYRGENELEIEAKKILKDSNIDLIFCTSCDLSPAYTAYKLAKAYSLPYVQDFRDVFEQEPRRWFLGGLRTIVQDLSVLVRLPVYLYFRKKVTRFSNAAITVNNFHASILGKYNQNTSVIFNGYDHEYFYPRKNISHEKFIIIFAGSLSNEHVKNPDFLLSAIKQLSERSIITPDTFECIFYSGSFVNNSILDKIKEKNIEAYFEFTEMVEQTLLPEIYSKASILLLLSNSPDRLGPRGIMYSKIFEYFAMNRPVLCVSSDKGDVEALIKKTSSGLAARSHSETFDFILKHYNYWRENGFTQSNTDLALSSNFSRLAQAEQFAEVFDQVISNNKC